MLKGLIFIVIGLIFSIVFMARFFKSFDERKWIEAATEVVLTFICMFILTIGLITTGLAIAQKGEIK